MKNGHGKDMKWATKTGEIAAFSCLGGKIVEQRKARCQGDARKNRRGEITMTQMSLEFDGEDTGTAYPQDTDSKKKFKGHAGEKSLLR